ncbi:MAG: ATP-binding cassette domain-containing protein [Gammaproteobacteria bacterium]
MTLLRLIDASLAFGLRPLLDHADLEVAAGERVCLLGRNGEGKSSLLRVFAGEQPLDSGQAWCAPGTRIALLQQDALTEDLRPVLEVVREGVQAGDPAAVEDWQADRRVTEVLERLELDGTVRLADLSGGWRRRALLARALAADPQVLLLDEPTNHLDVEAILWLERFLQSYRGAVLFVSHDRAFIRRVATRIVELDRGRLTGWPGSYDEYLVRKAEALRVEAEQNALFDKRLAQEEVWIRKGIEARRTRNEGRVRALHALREERRQRRDRAGTARLQLQEAQASGKLVFEVEHLTHGFDGEPLIRDLSLRVMRGDRLALLGPNGAGKTTLLRLLLGQLEPATGSVRQGTRLEVAYFDQQRAQLDPEATVMENVTGGSDTVVVGGQRRHVSGWLQDFLFPPERLNSPVSMLSGGERNRLLLARLFAQPANLLVMDEPTNDLDVETLELLEERIADFNGTLLLVSHDREFVDRVATSVLAFEGRGRVSEYVGGFSDWLRQRPAPARTGGGSSGEASPAADPLSSSGAATGAEATPAAPRRRKLSYKDQRELDGLPARIAALEEEQAGLQARLQDPAFYGLPREQSAPVLARLQALATELPAAYERWESLESLVGN